MFQRNMKVSRMPMSAWNLMGENAQVTTPRRQRRAATRATTLPVKRSDARCASSSDWPDRCLRELDGQQIERVVDADAGAQGDHRQSRHLHADPEGSPSAPRRPGGDHGAPIGQRSFGWLTPGVCEGLPW